jgi:mono/diheme cytochrome c family protein
MTIISTSRSRGARSRSRSSAMARRATGTGCGAVLLAAFASCSSPELRPVSGADTFDVHCAACHGPRGEGDGLDAEKLGVPVPNLRLLSRRHGGVFPEEAVARYIDGSDLPTAHAGDRNMPVWGPVFDATSRIVPGADSAGQRIDAVLAFLRSIQE